MDRRLKALLIDMDGTLADTHPFLYTVYCEILKEQGHEGSPAEFEAWIGPRMEDFLLFLQEKYHIPLSLSELMDIFRKKTALLYGEKTALFEGTKKTLEEAFKRGLSLILVTSSSFPMAESFLKHKGLLPLFKGIVSGDMVSKGKPAPEIYLKALKDYSLEKEEVLVIEDSINGLKAATSAGLEAVQFGPVSYTSFFPEKVSFFDHWEKIDRFLKEYK